MPGGRDTAGARDLTAGRGPAAARGRRGGRDRPGPAGGPDLTPDRVMPDRLADRSRGVERGLFLAGSQGAGLDVPPGDVHPGDVHPGDGAYPPAPGAPQWAAAPPTARPGRGAAAAPPTEFGQRPPGHGEPGPPGHGEPGPAGPARPGRRARPDTGEPGPPRGPGRRRRGQPDAPGVSAPGHDGPAEDADLDERVRLAEQAHLAEQARQAEQGHRAEQRLAGPEPQAERQGRPRKRAGRRRGRLLLWTGLTVLVAAAVAVGAMMFLAHGSGRAHVLVTPAKLGTFVRRPQLEQQMNVGQLQKQVIASSSGQASHVVSAVYENSAGVSGTAQPQIVLFIGGNLAGVSPAGFISGFTTQFKGAQATSAGPMGGSASCVDAQAGDPNGVAMCIWADNDTFGVVASPTMSLTQLSAQMREIRPTLEQPAK